MSRIKYLIIKFFRWRCEYHLNKMVKHQNTCFRLRRKWAKDVLKIEREREE